MSDAIGLYIDGYTTGPPVVNEEFVLAGDVFFGSTLIYECNPANECKGAGGMPPIPYTLSADVASLASGAPDADYFTAYVRIETPGLAGSTAGRYCLDDPVGPYACVGQSNDIFWSVNFRWVSDLNLGTESEYSPVSGSLDLSTIEGLAPREQLRLGPAWLLNDAPSYPLPDTAGNEIGRILFTAAELPSSVSISCNIRFMDFKPGGETQKLLISVALTPYYLNTVPTISSEGLMCVL